MFFNKRFTIIFCIEMLLPWLVLVCGIPAIYYYQQVNQIEIMELFYTAAMVTGVVIVLIELVIGGISFVWMITLLFQNSGVKYSVSRKLVVWLCSGECVIGTLLLMLLVQGLTYAQSV